jgi:putative DNA primase/helicase
MNPYMDWALTYVARGWPVFPIWWVVPAEDGSAAWQCACPKGAACGKRAGKHPLTKGGLNDATLDEQQIRAWWGLWTQANIAIATGEEANLLVVDADCSEGKPGVKNITALSAKHGGMPNTPSVTTGSGGIHHYFIWTDKLKTGANVIAEAIDVRSCGGYVVAPPSRHASGRFYEWRK